MLVTIVSDAADATVVMKICDMYDTRLGYIDSLGTYASFKQQSVQHDHWQNAECGR